MNIAGVFKRLRIVRLKLQSPRELRQSLLILAIAKVIVYAKSDMRVRQVRLKTDRTFSQTFYFSHFRIGEIFDDPVEVEATNHEVRDRRGKLRVKGDGFLVPRSCLVILLPTQRTSRQPILKLALQIQIVGCRVLSRRARDRLRFCWR